jgi:hypothetical protein
MPDLDFHIDDVEAVPYAASPMLAFKLRVSQIPEEGEPLASIHSVILRCQVRLEPARRRYTPVEQNGLNELFGESHRWGQTVRSMLWTNAAVSVPAFEDQIKVDLPVACTWDFNVAATKYFEALADGEVPLSFLFSGTIFYSPGGNSAGDNQSLQVAQISWEKEATYRMPVHVWRKMMEYYYPNVAWLGLQREVFDRLQQFKNRCAMASPEQAIERLLDRADAAAGVAASSAGQVSP